MTAAVPSWSREDEGRAPTSAVEGVASGLVPAAARGRIVRNAPLAPLVWFKAGGAADWLFEPADLEDLEQFLTDLDQAAPVMALGLGSNLIVRDGGIRGVVIRLGRGFNAITVDGDRVTAGAAALDAHVARRAADG